MKAGTTIIEQSAKINPMISALDGKFSPVGYLNGSYFTMHTINSTWNCKLFELFFTKEHAGKSLDGFKSMLSYVILKQQIFK